MRYQDEIETLKNLKNTDRIKCLYAVHQIEDFSWDCEAPYMEFYWNSTQTVELLKVFLSLSNNM